MRKLLLVLVVAGWLNFTAIASATDKSMHPKEGNMKVKKITAVLFVEEIEPSLKFWVDRLGFQKTIEVPEGDKLAFVALQKDNVEIMYQTYKSADKDVPASVSKAVRQGPTFLYIDVANLDEVIVATKGVEVVMPVRTTFYGAREIGLKDPAGHFVTFAQQGVAQ